jgi:aryl-alcohol dehydrogenase-like predicted oxidoreductase
MGVGAWSWGDRLVWGFGRGYGEAEIAEAYSASREAGLDFFDTAEIYGMGASERFLGTFLRRSAPAVVATKFMPYPWRVRKGSLVKALRASLNRLGLHRVDLYQIHQPLPPRSIETWMAGLAEAVELGLTRAVGVSNYSPRQMERAHAGLARYGIPLASNQVRFSLIAREPERSGLLSLCRDLGVTLISYSPLGMGLLTGKYGPENPPPMSRRQRSRGILERLPPFLELMRQIGEAHDGRTPGQVAINWTLAKGTLPIPGAKTRRQAEENAGALGWQLTPEAIERLDEASARLIGPAPIS